MYDDLLDDPKVQRLPPALFKAWVNLLCLASKHGGKLPSIEDAAFALRMDEAALSDVLSDLVNRGLVDAEGDDMTPHNWNSRQFKSDKDDTAADRQRAKRERDRAKSGENVTRDITDVSRPPETEPDTETKAEVVSGLVLRGHELETVLRKAAGWENQPHPNLCVTGPIEAVMAAGADLESDVIPVIRGLAPKARAVGWKYFIGAIQDAQAARIAAGTGPPQGRIVPFHPSHSGAFARETVRRKHSREDSIAILDAVVDEAISRETASGAERDEAAYRQFP